MSHLKMVRATYAFTLLWVLVPCSTALSQPAPATITEVPIPEVAEESPSDEAEEAMLESFQESAGRTKWKGPAAKQVVSIQSFFIREGTAVQADFGESSIGENGIVFVTSVPSRELKRETQTQLMTQADLENYGGATAYFPPGKLIIAVLYSGEQPPQARTLSLRVLNAEETAPGQEEEADRQTPAPVEVYRLPTPQSIEAIKADATDAEVGGEVLTAEPESICANDDRTASDDRRVGRLMPIGCTGWLIGAAGDLALTAGHCHDSRMQIIEFQVPPSSPDGRTRPADIVDQYPIRRDTIQSRDAGVGRDWAIFRIGPNSNTGQMPGDRQGSGFMLSRRGRPQEVRVTGFGTDDDPRGPDPLTSFRNAQSQTQQTENGNGNAHARFHDDGDNDSFRYKVDTRGGNSGGPVIDEQTGGGNTTVAIHTHAGCESSVQGNQGTALSNPDFVNALLNFVSDPSEVFVD